jgi:predicted metal-binding protein
LLELEKTAFNAGYTLALALVNVKKTAEKAGMAILFPVSGNPSPMAMLLID